MNNSGDLPRPATEWPSASLLHVRLPLFTDEGMDTGHWVQVPVEFFTSLSKGASIGTRTGNDEKQP